MPRAVRIVFWLHSDVIVVYNIGRECDDGCSKAGKEITARSVDIFFCLVLYLHRADRTDNRYEVPAFMQRAVGERTVEIKVTYRNMARLEKMGDLRHASLAAQGSR